MSLVNELFINSIMESFSNPNSKELVEFLKENNMILDVVLQNSYFELDRYYEVYLGSLSGNKFYTSKNELRKNTMLNQNSLTTEEQVSLFTRISTIFLILYKKGIFINIEKILDKYNDEIEEDLKISKIDGDIAIDIQYKINGIKVFEIINHDATIEEFNEYGYSDEYYSKELKKIKDFIKISSQKWFHQFSEKTKQYIYAGEKLVELTLDIKSDGLLDFSPLLVDYFKALELETFLFYKSNYNSIISCAEKIKKLNCDDKSSRKNDLVSLREFAETIVKYKSRYDVSGTKPLYYLLKFFALGDTIKDITKNFISILSSEKLRILEKEDFAINQIKELGKNRNLFIHYSGIIESRNSFLMIYADVYSVLHLMTQIK